MDNFAAGINPQGGITGRTSLKGILPRGNPSMMYFKNHPLPVTVPKVKNLIPAVAQFLF